MAVFDVDGTMTDGGITYASSGIELKTFNVKDGFAIVNWIRLGKRAAIITGRNSSVVERRAKELGITHFYQGVKNKLAKLKEIVEKEGISLKETAAIGDDLNDYMMLEAVGMSFAPSDCSSYIDEVVDIKLSKKGGEGAVAEMIEYIVKKENLQEAYKERWKRL